MHPKYKANAIIYEDFQRIYILFMFERIKIVRQQYFIYEILTFI